MKAYVVWEGGVFLRVQSPAYLKIVKVKKGIYRVSYNKITRLLETSSLNEKIGYL